ncbi:MAG: DMT family transporter [Pseudomonadota bacterium]
MRPPRFLLSGQSGQSDNALGAFYMMCSMASFVVNDTIMKVVLQDVPLFQAIFVRGVFAVLFMALLCWQQGAFARPLSQTATLLLKWPVILRTAGEAGGTFFFLTALTYLPLANVTAVLQILPLTITLSAALFFGEKVGWRRYSAIAVGFIGVMLIIKPGSEGFTVFSVYALLSTLCITLRDMATKMLDDDTPSLLVSLMTAFAIFMLGALGSVANPWQGLSSGQVGLMTTAAAIIILGYLFSILTMRKGEVSFVAPFRYSILVWALLLGYFVFGEVPDGWAVTGCILVVGSGLFTFYRERQAGSFVK